MKFRTVLVPLLFVFSLGVAGFIVAKIHRVQSKQGFTLHITQTVYPANGSGPVVLENSVRYQKSDGSWRKDTTYSDGRMGVGFAQPGRGVFHVDEKNKRLDYLSAASDHGLNEESLRSESGFVGEERILGFKTFHIHSDSAITPGDYIDSYICPAVQGYPLKIVSGTKKGTKTVFEVTQVILGEPSFTVPDYPVDTTLFQKIHGSDAKAESP